MQEIRPAFCEQGAVASPACLPARGAPPRGFCFVCPRTVRGGNIESTELNSGADAPNTIKTNERKLEELPAEDYILLLSRGIRKIIVKRD